MRRNDFRLGGELMRGWPTPSSGLAPLFWREEMGGFGKMRIAVLLILFTLAAFAQPKPGPPCTATQTTRCTPQTDASGAYVPPVGAASLPAATTSTIGGLKLDVAGHDTAVTLDASGNAVIGATVVSPTAGVLAAPTVAASSPANAVAGDNYCDVAGGCTFNLPAITTATIGAKYCFFNDDTRAGAITLRAPASTSISAMSAAGSAAGSLASAGALGDAVCVKAYSTTKYKAVKGSGTWTPGA